MTFSVGFVFVFLRQGSPVHPRLASNSLFSCQSLSNAGITDMPHNTWLCHILKIEQKDSDICGRTKKKKKKKGKKERKTK
jgi:hypothetical protein